MARQASVVSALLGPWSFPGLILLTSARAHFLGWKHHFGQGQQQESGSSLAAEARGEEMPSAQQLPWLPSDGRATMHED